MSKALEQESSRQLIFTERYGMSQVMVPETSTELLPKHEQLINLIIFCKHTCFSHQKLCHDSYVAVIACQVQRSKALPVLGIPPLIRWFAWRALPCTSCDEEACVFQLRVPQH